MINNVIAVSKTGQERKAGEKPEVCMTCCGSMRQRIGAIIGSGDDPHFVAMGMAIGVFIGCTPTIPFHTLLALILAFILRGSKIAALLGSWVCNPFTLPFLYMGSYRIGARLLGTSAPIDFHFESISDLMESGMDTTLMMVTGGIVLGIIPGVAAYFITRYVAIAMRKNGLSPEQDSCMSGV